MIQVKHANGNRNLNTVLDEIFNTFPQTWGRDSKLEAPVAPANISDSADGFLLELLVPGRNKEDFKVSFDKGFLTIEFEKKEVAANPDQNFIRREFGFNSFKRTFNLDDKINVDAIEAKYENGILKLVLPKKEEVKVLPKSINIQ